MLLLVAANFYNIPGGLTWAAVPSIIIGLILAAPIAIVQIAPGMVEDLVGNMGVIMPIIDVFAPNHYAVLIAGVALLFISILWRILRSCIHKKVK